MSIKIKIAFLAVITASVILNANTNFDVNSHKMANVIEPDTICVQEEQIDTIHLQKVEACKAYMEWAMKNQGYNWSTTKLTPEAIVTACEENDFSIPFTLAIANLESCFGQTPRSKKTNSVFSVGLHDDGKNICTYKTQNESIVPFIDLIKSKYLINGEKTLNDLLAYGGFVSRTGHRYASNLQYEHQVKSIMNRIIKMHPILE